MGFECREGPRLQVGDSKAIEERPRATYVSGSGLIPLAMALVTAMQGQCLFN